MEVWKNIEGYDDYQVSNYGRVRSLKFGKERIMKMRKHPDGYYLVNLSKNGKQKGHLIHRLVAQAFIPNDDPERKTQINHIREFEKTNNHVDNLEWCDARYNVNYGTAIQRMKEKTRNDKRSKTVHQYSLDGEFIKEWPSINEVERQLGFYQQNISTCCLGKRKTAYGYIWRYAS